MPGNNQSELNLATDCIDDYFNDQIINEVSKNPLAVQQRTLNSFSKLSTVTVARKT